MPRLKKPIAPPTTPVAADALPEWKRVTLAEWLMLAGLLVAALWLRLWRLDLVEFKGDEAIAAQLALQWFRGGPLPQTGLMSSVGVMNPPFFIYFVMPLFRLSADPAAIAVMLTIQNVLAVALCWYVGRRYIGSVAGLIAAAMFAVSPWAVVYSRKIWAIDIEPLLMVLLWWSLMALTIGRKPKAIAGVLFICGCLCQNHFPGFAISAAVLAMLLLLRPRINWWWATGAVVASVILVIPYLRYQTSHDWADFRQALKTIGGQKFQIPEGITIHPQTGHRLPREEHWVHALAIMNAGEIEDVLGLSTSAQIDRLGIWRGKRGVDAYFNPRVALFDLVLTLQRVLFVVAWLWLAVRAVRSVRWLGRFPFIGVAGGVSAATAWILVLWVAGTLAVFYGARLWTLLLYYVVLYPTHFVAIGIFTQEMARRATQQFARTLIWVGVGIILVANVGYMIAFNRYLSQYGGAFGTYGSGVGYKRQAAQYLAERADVMKLVNEQRLLQLDLIEQGRAMVDRAQPDFAYMAALATSHRTNDLATNVTVLVVDDNRTNYDPDQVPQLVSAPHTNFGPMRLYFMTK